MDTDGHDPMWGPFLDLVGTPRPAPSSLPDRVAALDAELAARDALRRYTYAYDAKDVSVLRSAFHDDAVVVNPRGTYVGIDAITANATWAMERTATTFHFAVNEVVRVVGAGAAASMAAYLLAVVARPGTDAVLANASSYVADVEMRDGRWAISRLRITTNIPMTIPLRPRGEVHPGPTPTLPATSHDDLRPEHLA